MQIEKINGDNLKALLYSGAANLTEHKKEVNDLNVFPVPDGDTGTNMEFTMRGAIKGAESAEGDLSDVSKSMAKGSLMGARGNSGVILSQFLKGISIGFQEIRTAGAKELVSAFQTGVKYAYKSVLKPTEGTILTVMREATDYAETRLTASSTVEGVLTDFLKEAKASLKRTPDLLPVLKKAGVIDSGAQGLIYIVEGFRKCVRGEDDGTYEEVEADFAKGEEEVAIADSAECEKVKYGVVAVCTGDKLSETFTEMGVDRIIRGGQTMNPSSEDFIKAFQTLRAENILVFPNNSNVYLAAKQAADMYDKSHVIVLNTSTIAEGYAALTMLDTSIEDPERLKKELEAAAANVETVQVTYAVRDGAMDGVEFKKGDYIGVAGKTMLSASEDKIPAAAKAVCGLADIKEREIITVIYGADVSDEEKTALKAEIENALPHVEIYEIDGGQEVYSFVIAVE